MKFTNTSSTRLIKNLRDRRSKRLDADDDRDGEEIGRSLTADDHRDGEIGTATKVAQVLEDEEGDAVAEVEVEDSDSVKKPKYVNRVRTGYEWNKYNRTHYDGDNPPPKAVHGYKFNLFYPDLLHRSTIPSYSLERDGGSGDTCIVRFHAGPPYQDVAFRIVNREWDYSPKNGFKCTFDGGILRLYFNLKRLRYRR